MAIYKHKTGDFFAMHRNGECIAFQKCSKNGSTMYSNPTAIISGNIEECIAGLLGAGVSDFDIPNTPENSDLETWERREVRGDAVTRYEGGNPVTENIITGYEKIKASKDKKIKARKWGTAPEILGGSLDPAKFSNRITINESAFTLPDVAAFLNKAAQMGWPRHQPDTNAVEIYAPKSADSEIETLSSVVGNPQHLKIEKF